MSSPGGESLSTSCHQYLPYAGTFERVLAVPLSSTEKVLPRGRRPTSSCSNRAVHLPALVEVSLPPQHGPTLAVVLGRALEAVDDDGRPSGQNAWLLRLLPASVLFIYSNICEREKYID